MSIRGYHFTTAKYALESLQMQRVKVSTLGNLNDPFDLWALAISDAEKRKQFRVWQQQQIGRYGLLCFSENWGNPLLWGHYGGRHQGIALGFDLNEEYATRVKYLRTRPVVREPLGAMLNTILYTKYADWRYEREIRQFSLLDDCKSENGLYFEPFNPNLVLAEVVLGPLCDVTRSEILAACGGRPVRIIKSRLAFNSFRVVRDLRGVQQ